MEKYPDSPYPMIKRLSPANSNLLKLQRGRGDNERKCRGCSTNDIYENSLCVDCFNDEHRRDEKISARVLCVSLIIHLFTIWLFLMVGLGVVILATHGL
jgi:hypothetical protein